MKKKSIIRTILLLGILIFPSVESILPITNPETHIGIKESKNIESLERMHNSSKSSDEIDGEDSTNIARFKNENKNADIKLATFSKPNQIYSSENTTIDTGRKTLQAENLASTSLLSIYTPLDTEDILSTTYKTEPELHIKNAPNTHPVSTKYTFSEKCIEQKDSEMTNLYSAISDSQELASEYSSNLEKIQLMKMLESIVIKHTHLPKLVHSNDFKIIHSIFTNKDRNVAKIFRVSGKIENKTLWEVLRACEEGDYIDINNNCTDHILRVTLLYPSNLIYIPLIVHALLTLYDPTKISDTCLTLSQFDFLPNKNIFNDFQVFKTIQKLTISNVTICTSALNTLCGFTNLKELSFETDTVLYSNNTILRMHLPNLESLKIHCINKYYANLILTGLNSCNNLKSLDIIGIDFMDTMGLNFISNHMSIASLTLKNIVFDGCPDFFFLKRMQALKRLTMRSIFYSYTEKFKIEDLSVIKQNYNYINLDLGYSGSKIPEDYENIITRNREVGKGISLTDLCIDNKLYKDLGLDKIEPVKGHRHNICIAFANNIECGWVDSILLEFSLSSTHYQLDINTKPCTKIPMAMLLEYIRNIAFPFLQAKTIEKIHLLNSLNIFKKNAIMGILSDQIMKYAKNNKIKRLKLMSLVPSTAIDLYKIIMFNNSMPDLYGVDLINIEFVLTNTKPTSQDEESVMKYYKEYIQANTSSFYFKLCTFVKNGSAFKITGHP
ncbi:uncharacterized protein NEPG_00627 [Nematocida parisii ERTm1]|uniref:uncharacterized protein n=1 Tax=Nematocida parisii (strain ERTm1 / ATCC PRA-289) TaxID=881290 RepID=UPI000264BA62|nr:uncharacterized protein NEPG_00627 [Nematocida parisii ERTm1]EIJ95102.1 hypothetical protein NEPG_00627 [Nematocida parisii ERTm1]|eukprot:XP_013058458.1 hypothetical protein NEPG_00627 [Nematocida parisii ERTm1]